jgi:UDP-2-acetamido-3-amino-2,3-dideoxy-glucuronate N-acetyltransferase
VAISNIEKMEYFIHESSYADQGCVIGKGTKIWHFSHIMPKAVLGENCNIGQNVVVSDDVVLGRNVKVQNNVSIYTGVICEDDVFLGPSMVFTNVINPRSAVLRRNEYKKTIVKKGATIGANATIVCGIEIGEFAFIGAGTVVIKDVKPYALIVGNPARQTGWMSEHGMKLIFENNLATCSESGKKYILKDNSVYKQN